MANLRIVGGDNVRSITPTHLHDIALTIRAFAELVDEGNVSARKALLVTVDDQGMVDIAFFGEPVVSAEAVGLLELAKAKVINGSFKPI